jgi:cell wall assembly regulator SMI1
MRKTLLIMIVVLAIAGIGFFLFNLTFRAAQTLNPSTMPPVVSESMDALLQSLELELARHRPEIIPALNPGMTAEELQQAKRTLGVAIHPEMQALYRWHNGLDESQELFPGHGFWSLETAIQTHQDFWREYEARGMGFFMAHEKNWLSLFPDTAGDGYYYDPQKEYEAGAVFYNFREAGYYRYFPSIKNLLKALVECYQNGVYPQGAEPDFDMEDRIMNKYGVAVEQH